MSASSILGLKCENKQEPLRAPVKALGSISMSEIDIIAQPSNKTSYVENDLIEVCLWLYNIYEESKVESI